MSKTGITTVLFDLDGTLLPFVQYEFVKLYFGGLCRKLAPLGFDPDKVVKDVWGGTGAMIKNDGSRPNAEAFWEYFKAQNPDKPDVRPLCDEFYTNEFDKVQQCLKYKPDRKPIIEELRAAGYGTVLATNPIFPYCAQLTRINWANLSESDFSYITSYENSTFSKPNPRYFTELLEKIGRSPHECVMIGNSVAEDILPAQSLGMETFLVTEFMENPENLDISEFNKGTLEQAVEFVKSL